MKAAPFEYQRVRRIDDVLAALACTDRETRIIAGGQSLVPMMAMRLARPAVLVDINHVQALMGIERRDGAVVVGAATRQALAEHSAVIARRVPLLAAALPWVGHVQTRNRGTVGGSLAHGDPTAEIALVAVALGAETTLASGRGTRSLPVTAFLMAPMQTAAADDECLTEIRFPEAPGGLRIGARVEEVSPRAGDYAVLGAAAEVGLDAGGRCRHLRLAASGASPVAVRAAPVERALDGGRLDDRAIADAVRLLVPLLDPESDIQATAAYRRRVAPGLLARAITAARDRALEAAACG